MSFDLRGFKVFIASPGGLEDERKAFADEIADYNKNEATHRSVIFQAVGWEDTLPGIGRPQSIINQDLIQCDYFVLVLHDHWGSNPGKNKNDATSGTEEEYRIALECYLKEDPMKQLVCLFKSVPPNQLADPGTQLQKVLNFKKQIEGERQLMYSNFSSSDEFRSLIRKNLAQWLRDDDNPGSGRYISPQIPPPYSPTNDNTEIDSDTTNFADTDVIETVDLARKYAKEGKLVDAEIEFSKALIINPSENQLLSYASFSLISRDFLYISSAASKSPLVCRTFAL